MQELDPLQQFISIFVAWWFTGGWLLLIGVFMVWVVLMIISGVLTRLLRRSAMRADVSPDAVNGLILAIRLIFLYIGIIVLFLVLPPHIQGSFLAVVAGSSLLIGTSVGLAVGQAVTNLVAGLYVMFTRPFHVRHYVRIGSFEGIVQEISMNYTKILQPDGTLVLVPNKSVLDSAVTNFRIDKQKLQLEEEEADSFRRRSLRKVLQAIDVDYIVRYVFTMAFHTRQGIDVLPKAFDTVCRRWTKKFGFQPLYELTEVSHIAFTYLFTIFVEDPRKILQHKAQFMKDIVQTVFTLTN